MRALLLWARRRWWWSALVACGANVKVKDADGLTPLDCARTVAVEKVIRDAGGKGLVE